MNARWLPLLLLMGLLSQTCVARLARYWSEQEIFDESDFVGLVEPLANEPAKDHFPGTAADPKYVDAINTRFRVLAVFKSRGDAPKEVTVLHFVDSSNAPKVANGPNFVFFAVEPVRYERRLSKDGKELIQMTENLVPRYVAFLKRRTDDRFEPVTGQDDPNQSFREALEPSLPFRP